MNQNVLALEAVLADGRILRAGSRARKSSAGYDLVRLLLGSEGTLAVITRLTLRLHPRPEAVGAATCSFPDLQAAVDTVTVLVQSGAPLARIEFLDAEAVRACNKASGMGLAERPTLFLEFHGTEGSVAEQSARAQDAAHEQGGEHFRYATLAEERTALWKARHSLYFSSLALRPGCECVVADVCVPISHLAASVGETRRDLDEAGLLAPMLGHVGDGNYHVLFLLDPASTEEQARAARVYDRMIDRAQRVGGSCTGEHGIGLGKREKLVAEAGLEGIAMMRAIKDSWDPLGILNPGKILLP
jgi:D-lactate dehydrogenase (cytochrome)